MIWPCHVCKPPGLSCVTIQSFWPCCEHLPFSWSLYVQFSFFLECFLSTFKKSFQLFILEYSWLTVLWWFWVDSSGTLECFLYPFPLLNSLSVAIHPSNACSNIWPLGCQLCLPCLLLLFFSHQLVSDSSQPHRVQHAEPPCPSPSPRVCPSSRALHWWCIQPSHPLSPSS